MRLFLAFLLMLAATPGAQAWAQMPPPPDAAPSTPVDEVALPAFEPTREEAVLEGYVDGVIAAHMREHDAPAVTVSVVRNGKIVFAKAYGENDVDARTPASGQDTMFRIGSVSKTFTWTAVMMLRERGLIDLDADVNVYLKDMQLPDAFDAPVTMNDLMAHRAGFEDTLAVFTYPDDGDVTLTDALKETMPKRVYAPGARTSYSNWGSALAAKIVEDVSGLSFREFLETEILKPLAMTHTTIAAPAQMSEAERASLATGYDVKAGAFEPAELMQIGPFAPAGAIASTADDMAHWMLFHLGGGEDDGVRLMRADTHELMWTRAFDDRVAGADLAHGFMTNVYRGVETFGHGGATTAYYTYMTLVPELELGVFVSQSTTNDRNLVSDLGPLVIDHLLDRPLTPAHDDPNFKERAAAFAGNYLNNRRSFSLFEKLFASSARASVAATEDGGLTVTEGGKSQHFAPLPGAADTFENRKGARIIFGRDEKGRVTHFTDGSGVHSYDRETVASNPDYLSLTLGIALFFAATTLIGAWRRQGRDVAQTGAGGLIGVGAMAAAVVTFVFVGATLWVLADLSNLGAAGLQAYPPASVVSLRFAGLVVFAVALVGLVSLWPAWRASGWGVFRKLHHTAFVIALAGLTLTLVFWNVIFAGTA